MDDYEQKAMDELKRANAALSAARQAYMHAIDTVHQANDTLENLLEQKRQEHRAANANEKKAIDDVVAAVEKQL